MDTHIVILAGGAGKRLWPASNGAHPKQFLDFNTGSSLYQRTLQRVVTLQYPGLVIVVTHNEQADTIARQSMEVTNRLSRQKDIHILSEPQARNTAPAIAYACAYLKSLSPKNCRLLVLPADHLIEPEKAFTEDAAKALHLAEDGYLVTFGIKPRYPETGYGYIRSGEPVGPGYMAEEFTEKPDLQKAETFLDKGNYFWNSGMFAFTAELFMGELTRFSSEISHPFSTIEFAPPLPAKGAVYKIDIPHKLEEIYRTFPAISVDKALMEKSTNRAMVRSSFRWSDVGSWDQVAEHFPQAQKKIIATESKNNYVLSDIPVALVGVTDLHVIVKNNVVLVCKKGSSQLVKKTVDSLKLHELQELL
jgi:mannose-1-phosphate guanylyltransferase/mannose-6-phosphate isomerase